MGKPRQFRALERAQYEFDFDAAPLREHRLYAYAYSAENLRGISSWNLIRLFENFYRFPRFDPVRREWRIKHLKGFFGDYFWADATLRFGVRGPDIPFFGLIASQQCKGVPFLYTSCALGVGQPTEPRYFYNGEELFRGTPEHLAKKYAELEKAGRGVICGGVEWIG